MTITLLQKASTTLVVFKQQECHPVVPSLSAHHVSTEIGTCELVRDLHGVHQSSSTNLSADSLNWRRAEQQPHMGQ
eukprot:3580550-Amphidinium_carterae.1